MLFTNIKIAFRQLRKNPLYTGLNIAGLALGITACLLIALYVRDELSFDRFHEKAGRIYRINSEIKFGGKHTGYAVAPDPMGFTMKTLYPEVEDVCRFRTVGGIVVRKDQQNVSEEDIVFADSTLFNVFTFPLTEGDPRTALRDPWTMVITESAAERHFGTRSGVVGRTLHVDNERDWRITGVMRDPPAQSHIDFDFFLSMASRPEAWENAWPSHNFNTYLLLRPGVDPRQLEQKFPELVKTYTAPQIQSIFNISYEDVLASGDYVRYSLMPLVDIHLHSDRDAEMAPNGDARYVWIFGAVALFILTLACINFMNLSTARASGRAREVGLRKVMGSARGGLIAQFLAESLVLTLIAFSVALVAVAAVLPGFNRFAGKEIEFGLLDPNLLGSLAALAVFTALLAGSYPAFYLSAFRPLQVLKGRFGGGAKRSWLRSGLVVFQFCTSIALIISVVVVQKQLRYVQTTRLGFDKSQMVLVRNIDALGPKTTSFLDELRRLPGVEAVTASYFFPVPSARNENVYFPEGVTDPKAALTTQSWDVDPDYIATMRLELAQGRDFDPNLPTDSSTVVINEAAARVLGWTDPLGKKISTWFDNDGQGQKTFTVIGVVKNFHFESLRQRITPLVLRLNRFQPGMAGVRLSPGDPQPALRAIEASYREFLPAETFRYAFLDEEFETVYRAEQRIGQILGWFAGFAIFIACLGLFGLAAYTTEQRTREIGIRKVLGATVAGITGLLARDFLRLVALALLLATPLAWYTMHRWLQDFAYRTALEWWLFAVAGLAALAIALLTVSFQSVRAALANPVKSLRQE